MKKSMILLGMLSIGYAYAQEGNVGINTENPKATLDIVPEATNLTGTTNEGIIAPRLSKTRIANIEVSKLTEGTLVYATDDTASPISAYTGTDTKVAKITEKGYYFYNGTEWVKVQYKDNNDAEWVYDDVTKRINLKRSGLDTFVDKVYYDTKTGQYINAGVDGNEKIKQTLHTSPSAFTTDEISVSSILSKNINYNSSNQLPTGTGTKYINFNRLNVEGEEANNLWVNHSDIVVSNDNTQNYNNLYGDASVSRLYGQGSVGSSIAQWGQMYVLNQQSISNYATAILGSSSTGTSGNVNNVNAARFNNVVLKGGGTIENFIATDIISRSAGGDDTLVKKTYSIKASNTNSSTNTGQGEIIAGVYNTVAQNGKIQFPKMYGIYTSTTVGRNAVKPTEMYGIYVDDVNGAAIPQGQTEAPNYSIYTKAGKVRVGDLADTSATAYRNVVVDKDGVLKIGESADTTLKATDTTDQCTADKAGTIHYKEVAISGATNGEKKGVFGFCTKQNGNAIWVYLSNGGNIMQGTGTFGQGL